MPSKSRKFFHDKLYPDVVQLIATHGLLNAPGRGRRYLGHITRSGVVMLCAAWELYTEEVIVEGIDFLVKSSMSPEFLPANVKTEIASVAKKSKHDHGALELCGDGWKDVYKNAAVAECAVLNTPKFSQVSGLFQKWLGVPAEELEGAWRHPADSLNDFVGLRGEIAHRGADAQYVRIERLTELTNLVDDLVVDTDNFLCHYLRRISTSNKRPWNAIPVAH
ncbi:HEPN domain-containing protein [Defluviimonas sp. WL0002]|uniref:HEPN domain-containing protein n=1 Tax=Albidovulum marisflavi TaxID=2984159 RepID=A0ABT2ZAQ5_9RHOB|nr:HEPN domain-containing protein [Defluviimonas sp. WL0002]MCV2868194.1 HEPN domain-containing protein [Defluviimonas sp. WL0002]